MADLQAKFGIEVVQAAGSSGSATPAEIGMMCALVVMCFAMTWLALRQCPAPKLRTRPGEWDVR